MRGLYLRMVLSPLPALLAGPEPLDAAWIPNGNPVCTATGDQRNPSLIPDGQGGTIIVWNDARNGNWDIYAQRVDGDGIARWTTDGVAICTRPNYQADLSIVAGAAMWPPDGILVCDVAYPHQSDPITVSDGAGGLFLAWWQGFGPMWEYVDFVQHVDSSGTMFWSDKMISSIGGAQWIAGTETTQEEIRRARECTCADLQLPNRRSLARSF